MTRYLLLMLLLPAAARADGFAEDLDYGGATLAALLQRLRVGLRSDALEASRVILVHAGPDAHEAAPQVLMGLKHTSPVVRARLASALGRMGPRAVPSLRAALHFDDEQVRIGAARALAEMGPVASPAQRALFNVIRNTARDAPLRVACFEAWYSAEGRPPRGPVTTWMAKNCSPSLVRLANSRPAVLDTADLSSGLTELLSSPSPEVRRDARRLALLAGPRAVPALVRCLGSLSARARLEACEALGVIGHPDAVAPLMGLAERGTPGTRAAACRALGRIGSTRAGPALMAALGASEADVRAEAAVALGRLGPAAGHAAPALCEALSAPEPEVALAARAALARIGKPALPSLLRLLRREDELQRGQALRALREMGPAAAATAGALLAARVPGKPYISRDVCEALAVLGPEGIKQLAGPASEGDEQAIVPLQRLGPLAAPAVEGLARALGKGDMNTKRAILEALRQAGPAANAAAKEVLALEPPALRPLALSTLANIGAPPKDAAPLVKKALASSEDVQRLAALNYLAVEGRGDLADEALVKLLEDDGPVAARAADLLLLDGKAGPVVEYLKKALRGGGTRPRLLRAAWARDGALADSLRKVLKGTNPDLTVLAAHALLRADPKDDEAAKALVALLRSAGDWRAAHLFDVVALQTGRAEEFVPVLAELAGPRNDFARRLLAAQALGAFGEKAGAASGRVLLLLADVGRQLEGLELLAEDSMAQKRPFRLSPDLAADSQTRARLKAAVAGLDAQSDEALEELRSALPALRADLEERLLEALSALGRGAVRAAEASLADERTHVRRAAALFLARAGKSASPAAVALKKAVKDHDPLTAVRCASALAGLGQRASVPALVRGLAGDEEAALEALSGLEALGERGPLPAVASAMRRLEPRVRAAACRALAKAGLMGPVRAALRDRAALVRLEAALLLWRADKKFRVAPALAEAIASPDVDTVEAGLRAAAECGAAARSLWPAILPQLSSPVPSLRLAAAVALHNSRGDVVLPHEALKALAEDDTLRPSLRLRAVRALARVSGKRARLTLTRLLHGPLPPGPLRDAVVKALG